MLLAVSKSLKISTYGIGCKYCTFYIQSISKRDWVGVCVNPLVQPLVVKQRAHCQSLKPMQIFHVMIESPGSMVKKVTLLAKKSSELTQ